MLLNYHIGRIVLVSMCWTFSVVRLEWYPCCRLKQPASHTHTHAHAHAHTHTHTHTHTQTNIHIYIIYVHTFKELFRNIFEPCHGMEVELLL